jgi:predicted O-linked N-acetylglucosamine transferase (SPINDLY family)
MMNEHDTALRLLAEGKWSEAGLAYETILERLPGDYQALHNLGIIRYRAGRTGDAESLFRRAALANPDAPEVHNSLGLVLKQQGRLAEAVPAFQKAVALNPAAAEAAANCGYLLAALGRIDEAMASFRQVPAESTIRATAMTGLGQVLRRAGRLDEAEAALTEAVALKPEGAEAWFELGLLYSAKADWARAEASYRRALALKPDSAEAGNNLAQILERLGRPGEAFEVLEHAAGACQSQMIWANFALSAYRLGRTELAAQLCRKAAGLGSDAGALDRIAEIMGLMRLAGGVLEMRRRLAELAPDSADAQFRLGLACNAMGRADEARAALGQALTLQPDHLDAADELAHMLRKQCDWDDLPRLESVLLAAVQKGSRFVAPFSLLSVESADAALQLKNARRVAVEWGGISELPSLPATARPQRDRIRLGYLSSDFGKHATSHLISGLFECHDRTRFEVFAFCYRGEEDSAERRRIQAGVDHFQPIDRLADVDAARVIRQSDIDILIDLKGYTEGARMKIVHQRVAPVQVHYLGYPGTTGSPYLDYLLVDDFLVPPDLRHGYSEALAFLPQSYQINDSKRPAPRSGPGRTHFGLPEDGFVFCGFNQPYKISPTLFGAWMRLLNAVPGSVLWLLAEPGAARDNLRRRAHDQGIDPDRLIFTGALPLAQHLSRYRLADLFLDTAPINAHTTASDALWAGLPVLSRAGATFAGRVAGSLLRACGLPELITHSLAEYEDKALALARDPAALGALRARLQPAQGPLPLFDTIATTRSIEAAYGHMWDRHRQGMAPADFHVADLLGQVHERKSDSANKQLA